MKDKPWLEDSQTHSSFIAFMPNTAAVKIRREKKSCFFKAQKASLHFRSTSLFSTVEIIASIVQVLTSYKG